MAWTKAQLAALKERTGGTGADKDPIDTVMENAQKSFKKGEASDRNKKAASTKKHPSARPRAGKSPGEMVAFSPFTDRVREAKDKAKKKMKAATRRSYYDGSK